MPDRYSLPKAIGWSIAFVVLTLLLAGLLAFGIAVLITGSVTGAVAWLESAGAGPLLLQSAVTLGATALFTWLIGMWRPGSVPGVRCPGCGSFDDKVVDSRQADDGTSIRRRRACIDCGRRFTTFERVEESPLVVVKRSGDRQPFDREKVAIGMRLAAKGRPIEADGGGALDELITAVEDAIRLEGLTEVPTEAVGRAVLEHLREADPVAAVRFASVYLGFDDLSDFEREITLLAKRTAPKRH
jgi:transcriptional repressor NrdR